jgi:tight adherence protein B
MNATGALIGLTLAGGFLLVVDGLISRVDTPKPKVVAPSKLKLPPINTRLAGVGLALGLVVAVATGWWAGGVLVVAASILVPMMQAERQAQVKDRQRINALASWVESVRDLLAAASGIEEAIVRSSETLTAESPIVRHIWQLRVVTEMLGLREGLRRLGEDLADPIGDYITAALLVASERPSGVVHMQLSEAASNARESVSVRERVEASRARMWTASSTIAIISLCMVAFIVGTQSTYATWYSQPTGQIVLLVCGGIELVGMWWMARMARPSAGHRVVLFDPPTTPTSTTAASGPAGRATVTL